MNRFLVFLCLFFVSQKMLSQCCTPEEACNFRSIAVHSGNTTSITLRHVGPASIQPTAGQQTNWILGTTTNPNITNITITVANGLHTFNLTSLGISSSDVIVATCNIISTTGTVCTISNQNIVGTIVGTPPFTSFQWIPSTPVVNGVFSQPPLAVDWLYFTGERNDDDVHLRWSTAREVNNEGYEVLVSTESKSWETIGFVNGKGDTRSITDYTFVHQDAPKKSLYYKLIEMDNDGKTNESSIIFIKNREVNSHYFEIYPNPSNGKATIDLGAAHVEKFTMNVYNSIGQLVNSINQDETKSSVISLDLSESGLYFVEINRDGHQLVKRFIVE